MCIRSFYVGHWAAAPGSDILVLTVLTKSFTFNFSRCTKVQIYVFFNAPKIYICVDFHIIHLVSFRHFSKQYATVLLNQDKIVLSYYININFTITNKYIFLAVASSFRKWTANIKTSYFYLYSALYNTFYCKAITVWRLGLWIIISLQWSYLVFLLEFFNVNTLIFMRHNIFMLTFHWDTIFSEFFFAFNYTFLL